jgi:hypothetical protein
MGKARKIDDRAIRVRRQIGKRRCLREYLGRLGYTIAFLTVVLAWTTLGAAISLVVSNRPTIETRNTAPEILAPSPREARRLPGPI